jgi:2-polyprenyl-3-methyl-5-hydroxy-6-metoxy-1,4-benzoquinol methylase
MPGQVGYYNDFGIENRDSILACPEPELWTTDYNEKGRIYKEIKERIQQQEQLIKTHFKKEYTVLDIGCGFGRQAFMMARNGYKVTGTDTSAVFIELANKLFQKHGLKANFICTDITSSNSVKETFRQMLLLDVLEHIAPQRRALFFQKIYELAQPGALLLLSLPHVKERVSSQINNKVRRSITQYFTYFLRKEEHPYPIPEKKDILQLAKGYFVLNNFIHSAQTDYYLFQKS